MVQIGVDSRPHRALHAPPQSHTPPHGPDLDACKPARKRQLRVTLVTVPVCLRGGARILRDSDSGTLHHCAACRSNVDYSTLPDTTQALPENVFCAPCITFNTLLNAHHVRPALRRARAHMHRQSEGFACHPTQPQRFTILAHLRDVSQAPPVGWRLTPRPCTVSMTEAVPAAHTARPPAAAARLHPGRSRRAHCGRSLGARLPVLAAAAAQRWRPARQARRAPAWQPER